MSAICLLLCLTTQAPASDPPSAVVRIQLILPSDGRGLLAAQTWGRYFDDAGYRMTTRRAIGGVKPEITEEKRGRLRTVTVVFVLARDGSLATKGHTFPAGGSERLTDWLDELKAFGAAGRPDGQPQWGLAAQTLTQIETLAATEAIAVQTVGQLAGGMADRFQTPVELADAVQASFRLPPAPKLACGTVAAWQLDAVGCCWLPQRQPDGTVHIRFERLGDVLKPWPVGWIVPRPIRTDLSVPKLFQLATYPNRPTKLPEWIADVSKTTATEVLPLTNALKKKPQWTEAVVFVDSPTARPYPTLARLLARQRLTKQVRLDDAGTGFVVFMPFVPGLTTPMTVSPLIPSRVKSRLETFAATP